jgi:hypothetical protein
MLFGGSAKIQVRLLAAPELPDTSTGDCASMTTNTGTGRSSPGTYHNSRASRPAEEKTSAPDQGNLPFRNRLEAFIQFIEGLSGPAFRIVLALSGILLFLAWFITQVIPAIAGLAR